MTTEIVLTPDQAGRDTSAATPTPAVPIPAFTGQVPGDPRQAIRQDGHKLIDRVKRRAKLVGDMREELVAQRNLLYLYSFDLRL